VEPLVEESQDAAPETAVEKQLAALWQELLDIKRVSVHDNFFELGGHSLLTTQLVSRIRTAFQVELPLRRIFDSRTLAELAAAITNAPSTERSPLSARIMPVARERYRGRISEQGALELPTLLRDAD
jgi:acyl carrier protein